MKVLKNKRRIDPRYHLDEKRERVAQKSNSEVIEEVKKSFDGQFSFDSWLNESNCSSHKRNDDNRKEKGDKRKVDCKPDSPDLDKDGDKDECISDAAEEAEAQNEMQVMAHSVEKPMSSAVSPDDMSAKVPESPCAAKEKGAFEVSSRFGTLTTTDKSADSLKAASNFAMHLLHNMGLSPEEVQMSPEISAVVTESDTPEGVEEG